MIERRLLREARLPDVKTLDQVDWQALKGVAKPKILEHPEINLARTLSRKYRLKPPIDIDSLAKRYARVEVTSLPLSLDVDGATFDLKIPGKRPTIIINKDRPRRRSRFTLAHELGHVMIPWHVGSILDEDILRQSDGSTPYWQLEHESNRFASELLMPANWIEGIIQKLESPRKCFEFITDTAEVSRVATAISLNNCMPEGYVFVVSDDAGLVKYSGRSADTLINQPARGVEIDLDTVYPISDRIWKSEQPEGLYVWWRFPGEVTPPAKTDQRAWREILNDIVADLNLPPTRAEKIKQSVNGIFANANTRAAARSVENIYAAALQRFHARSSEDQLMASFVSDKRFSSFLRGRCEDVLSKKK